MRLNRKIRIGAALVALALLLLGLVTITRRLQSAAPVASNANTNTPVEPSITAAPASSGRVAVARENIPERSIVTSEMLEFRDAPAGFDRRAFVTDLNAQAVGFVTARPIAAGRDVRQADLLGHISDVGVAGALLPGHRAMILPIGSKATLHDLVRIGDHVDIVASFDQQESRVIAEDVRVLAVDVFGNDYPQVKIAMRGDYKAPARSISASNPPSPSSGAAPAKGQPSPDAPPGQQPAAGASVEGVPGGSAPEPTPTQGPPPARPESALTIEVTPQQATDIALTQSAGQNIDFLLRARSEPRIPTGTGGAPEALETGGVSLASGESRSATFSIREKLAPYAARTRRAGVPTGSNAASASRTATRNTSAPARSSGGSGRQSGSIRRGNSRLGGGSSYIPPALPDVPPPTRDIAPANPNAGTPVLGPSRPNIPSRPALSPTYDIPIIAANKLVRVDTVRRPAANR
jgi:Flp pilus assembly protein CpaB